MQNHITQKKTHPRYFVMCQMWKPGELWKYLSDHNSRALDGASNPTPSDSRFTFRKNRKIVLPKIIQQIIQSCDNSVVGLHGLMNNDPVFELLISARMHIKLSTLYNYVSIIKQFGNYCKTLFRANEESEIKMLVTLSTQPSI